MKRDMDLVRKILLAAEASTGGFAGRKNPEIEGYTPEQIGYHAYLMKQAGLVDGPDTTHMESSGPEILLTKLTWAGHEFLDLARSASIWEQGKEVVSNLGDVSFTIWVEVLKKIILDRLGMR